MNLKIDPHGLPLNGLHLEGELPASVFDLPKSDPAQPVSPLALTLDVTLDDDDLVVTGALAATFEMVCSRCAERFQQRLTLEPYEQTVPIENDAPIDLTTWVREDMLLALPPHPRCENGNVTPRECPAEGRFEPPADAAEAESGKAEGSRAWEALDQLSNIKRN
jgi:uncharacterized metal-binding protein YceD (DUF177 family)